MSLTWVTGVSGAGKSAVIHELRRRGYLSFDADEGGITVWRGRETGCRVGPEEVLDLAARAWCIERPRVEELADLARDRVVFLGGSVENELEVWDLFDNVVCLVADDATIRYRIATRTNNSFGKDPDVLQAILGWNATVEETYRGFGATIVDASQPLSAVADAVVVAATAR